MTMTIHCIHMGPFTNAFLIKAESGSVLVDAGYPHHEKSFKKQIQRISLESRDIALIIATHGHADHVGSLRALKNETGAAVAIHRADSHLLQKGILTIPPAVTMWGTFIALVFQVLLPLGRFEPVEPDIIIDQEVPLHEFGISGKILPTPGHTPGSVSVVLDSGEAFVGDLAVNAFPLGIRLGIPSLAENVQEILKSWEKLLSAGAKMIFPAHGDPFPADRLRERLSGSRPKDQG
jgi:glyoxylase-like metal-dependent hydrolase (beta-lactamase superfamily II)